MNDSDFIGEIRYFCFDYVPEGWLVCDGTQFNVRSYAALFAVIGNAYGGDGSTTFNVPDLRGRAAIGLAPTYQRGEVFGAETVTLSVPELPPHTHQMVRPGGGKPYAQKLDTPSSVAAPGSLALSNGGTIKSLANTGSPNMMLHQSAVTAVGGGLAHDNLQPYQVFKAGICYDGVFPPRP
ncbi:phage tail protein [Azorhizobium doebereinerae]|uniref:phage tail protein n=1 Tax=Azorhizobium doebereinerae TaxID=281091 RepID=UPI00041DEF2B|nr:tail fiber protein [Azorhizobium doebereinerae]